jgi:hypothetical protein
LCEQLSDVNATYRGMLIIAAAGNESKRPDYAVSVAPPANAFGVVSVGAVGRASGNSGHLDSGTIFKIAWRRSAHRASMWFPHV